MKLQKLEQQFNANRTAQAELLAQEVVPQFPSFKAMRAALPQILAKEVVDELTFRSQHPGECSFLRSPHVLTLELPSRTPPFEGAKLFAIQGEKPRLLVATGADAVRLTEKNQVRTLTAEVSARLKNMLPGLVATEMYFEGGLSGGALACIRLAKSNSRPV